MVGRTTAFCIGGDWRRAMVCTGPFRSWHVLASGPFICGPRKRAPWVGGFSDWHTHRCLGYPRRYRLMFCVASRLVPLLVESDGSCRWLVHGSVGRLGMGLRRLAAQLGADRLALEFDRLCLGLVGNHDAVRGMDRALWPEFSDGAGGHCPHAVD